MPLNVNAGFDGLELTLNRLMNPPVREVLAELESVIFNDNMRGVLAGTDKDGNPLAKTVREQTPEGHWVSYRLPDGRLARYYQTGRAGDHPGDGAGPPLAPHGAESRVVKDLATAHFEDAPGEWVVFGAWENLLSFRGVPFLPFHFRGEGRLPARDLAGLRPEGQQEAIDLVDRWARGLATGGGTP